MLALVWFGRCCCHREWGQPWWPVGRVQLAGPTHKDCGSVDWVRSGVFQSSPAKVGVSAEVQQYTHLRYVGSDTVIDITNHGITEEHWEFHDMHCDMKASAECVRGDFAGSEI